MKSDSGYSDAYGKVRAMHDQFELVQSIESSEVAYPVWRVGFILPGSSDPSDIFVFEHDAESAVRLVSRLVEERSKGGCAITSCEMVCKAVDMSHC